MGQYWKPVNLDKKEFIHAHKLGSGLKMVEQAGFSSDVAAALILLLSPLPDGPRGGGDCKAHPILGHWAGDRIAMVGDYSKDSDLPGVDNFASIYDDDSYTDISDQVADLLRQENLC